MRHRVTRVIVCMGVMLASLWATHAYALDPPPQYGKWVVDSARVISRTDERALEAMLADIERNTGGPGKGAQVVIHTVRSLAGTPANDYALATFRAWGLGSKGYSTDGRNNGLLILYAKDNGSSRPVSFIMTGTGLQGRLPDGKVGELQRRHLGPNTTAKTTAEALTNLMRDISAEIYAEYRVTNPRVTQPTTDAREQGTDHKVGFILIVCFFLIFVAGAIGVALRRKPKTYLRFWAGGLSGAGFYAGVALLATFSAQALYGMAAIGYILGYFCAKLMHESRGSDPVPDIIFIPSGSSSGDGGGRERMRAGGGETDGGGAGGDASTFADAVSSSSSSSGGGGGFDFSFPC